MLAPQRGPPECQCGLLLACCAFRMALHRGRAESLTLVGLGDVTAEEDVWAGGERMCGPVVSVHLHKRAERCAHLDARRENSTRLRR